MYLIGVWSVFVTIPMLYKEYNMKKIWIPQAIVIPLLLLALNPDNPYGYYIFLRWVCCAAFVYLVFHALALEKKRLGLDSGGYGCYL